MDRPQILEPLVNNLLARTALTALLIGLPVVAQAAEEDVGAWSAINATAALNNRVSLTMDTQLRFSNDVSRLGQYLIRPSVGLKVGANTTLSLGYAYFHTDPVGPALSDEHRVWQQAAFRLAGNGNGRGLTLTGRSRLEQRWVEGSSGMGLRLRQQLRLTAPVSGKVRAVAWTEPFIAFNDTQWGQRSGLDRWRNFAGLNAPLSKAVSIEPGYLNQWVNRRGADLVQHIGSVTLTAKF